MRKSKRAPGASDVGDRLWHLRNEFGWTQEEVAERSAEEADRRLRREDIVNVEKGRNQATTTRVRGGLAHAFGLSIDAMGDYLEGRLSLESLLTSKAAPTRTTEYDPRYPNREAAIRQLVDEGKGSEEDVRAAADLVGVALKSETDPAQGDWYAAIRRALRGVLEGREELGVRPARDEDFEG